MLQTAAFVSTLFHGPGNADKMTVALTMALNARLKGHSACLILMAEGVALGVPGTADGINIGQPFEPAADLLSKYLAEGGRVELRGFGAFSVRSRPERQGRNPRTGETVHVPAKSVPFFKSGKELRERLNAD